MDETLFDGLSGKEVLAFVDTIAVCSYNTIGFIECLHFSIFTFIPVGMDLEGDLPVTGSDLIERASFLETQHEPGFINQFKLALIEFSGYEVIGRNRSNIIEDEKVGTRFSSLIESIIKVPLFCSLHQIAIVEVVSIT